jgi:hypothetical protein
MSRMNANPNPRIAASALSAIAAAIGTVLITAAPAQADHFEHAFRHHVERVAVSHLALAGELFFGPPVPIPVYVRHEVGYRQPYYVEHRAHRHGPGCRHGHGWHRRGHGRGDWDDGRRGGHHDRRGRHERWEVMNRGGRY